MEKEIRKLNEEKIREAYKNSTKIHITLKNKTWRNGYVKEIHPDFFVFYDNENGIEPIFFLEVHKVEPFLPPKFKTAYELYKEKNDRKLD